ncbi:head completion/stabilization protein [Hydrogenophaga sp.]|uniref:head completion/stabilization protein n=1 Tax=Hydrogenophaga sp. TaxID=1904254 RepID=UPI003F6EC71B
MSFLANQSPPPADEEPTVANDGWFPDLKPARIRAQARLDGTVTPLRLRSAIATAMAEVNAELVAFKARHLAAGACDLESVPGPEVADEVIWALHYRNAITSHILAALSESYRHVDTTAEGERKAEELEATTAGHRRNLHWSIAALCGRPRTTVELI